VLAIAAPIPASVRIEGQKRAHLKASAGRTVTSATRPSPTGIPRPRLYPVAGNRAPGPFKWDDLACAR
jgi:hypothetical protein